VHDAIAERFPELTLPSRRARLLWALKVGFAVRQARLVLTVSDFAAKDLTRFLRIPERRIRVAVEAPAPVFQPARDPERLAEIAARLRIPPNARWFIYVGGFNPHKHVEAIVQAHAEAVRGVADAPYLLLVGTVDGDVFHGGQQQIRRAIQDSGTERLVIWTGFVADEDLRYLHSGALALVMASACEGFGLPAVEAAACGAPSIATTESPLPQLLAGGGIFVAPADVPAIGAAMRYMMSNDANRAAMGHQALRQAGDLSWGRTAQVALQVLEEAVA
jgi:alpha-1,3-rhamnosyl/mannosyltransferase